MNFSFALKTSINCIIFFNFTNKSYEKKQKKQCNFNLSTKILLKNCRSFLRKSKILI